ncbi:MAG: helix-turn-helix domain-containing protein [Chloroflexi bacterium]|nr:MAG: helix-turn-helix domain-containing protein [Chloroflexota bacterium]
MNPFAVSKRDAAAMLGISVDSFERYVQAELKVAYVGRRRVYPVAELEKWLREHSGRPLEAA